MVADEVGVEGEPCFSTIETEESSLEEFHIRWCLLDTD